jgi:PAS domain S-box-containing protein
VPSASLETARLTGRHDTEGWRTRKDGTTFWASEVITALHKDGGQLVGFVKIVRDIFFKTTRQNEKASDVKDGLASSRPHIERTAPVRAV